MEYFMQNNGKKYEHCIVPKIRWNNEFKEELTYISVQNDEKGKHLIIHISFSISNKTNLRIS